MALRQETGETRGGSQQVERLCRQFRKKLSVRRQALLSDIKETGRTEECRRKGELILANLKSTRKGMERISLVNLHEDGQGKVEVELDASLDGKANARRYFKLYNKLKNKKLVAEKRLKETDGIMEELEELFSRLGQGYEPVDVKERLEGLGLIWTEPGEGSKVVKEKLNVNSIIKHVDPQGWEILVGKNGRANDYLTTKVAGRDDIWLHVRGTPGAHVVIRNPSGKVDIPRSVLEKGARLAALNSRMKNASKATVDYTFRKHVRKPKGAPEGAVVIKKHKSITIFLDELDE